jgi:hypothetical protein
VAARRGQRARRSSCIRRADRLHHADDYARSSLQKEPAGATQDEFERGIKEDVVDGLLGHGADEVQPVLACIVDTITARDRELLDELERLVQEKKRELERS